MKGRSMSEKGAGNMDRLWGLPDRKTEIVWEKEVEEMRCFHEPLCIPCWQMLVRH